jgi:hypothetical protein
MSCRNPDGLPIVDSSAWCSALSPPKSLQDVNRLGIGQQLKWYLADSFAPFLAEQGRAAKEAGYPTCLVFVPNEPPFPFSSIPSKWCCAVTSFSLFF